MDQGGADFKRFFSWFRNSEDIENERRLDSKRFRDSGLQAARRAIEVFTGFENVRIRRRGQLRMTVEKEGRELSVAQLSD
ncbi:ATP-binding protein, partial [Acinetobacter baumannii]